MAGDGGATQKSREVCLIPPDRHGEEKGRIEGREEKKNQGRKERMEFRPDRQTEVSRSDAIAIYRFSIKSDVLAKTVEDMEVEELSFEFIIAIGPLSTY